MLSERAPTPRRGLAGQLGAVNRGCERMNESDPKGLVLLTSCNPGGRPGAGRQRAWVHTWAILECCEHDHVVTIADHAV